ncbi:glycosyl-phosphatidylinositol-anchored molecule-like protein [Acomys russatus]|uniref:glycosyl-phosphatidylinositol-anchored molecule-like protein n=1 Tax=Acomys russatus TaxID=60746 RepID=UPI0021E33A22|nr:glycosyl-phosphatidylinositol-anchored molecule-like protein [Acomys russatus]
MLPFFLLLLLGLPRVGTTVNNATGLDNSTSGLSIDIEPRQGMNSRELLTYKNCNENCSFYYVHCCVTHNCNNVGPSNIERDLLPDAVVEETTIERAVCLGEFNLLLSLASILSSGILA